MKSEKQRLHLEKLARARIGAVHTKKTKDKIALSRKIYIGSKASNWKGGKMLVGDYVYIYSPKHPHRTKNGYVCEHRLVMEKHIGRFLNKKEVVHHINEIKNDNRIVNLKLFSSSGEHTLNNHTKRNKLNGRFI